MRLPLFLTAAAVAAAILTATASAGTASSIRHYAWKRMSLTQRIHAQRHLIIDDWRVISTWDSQRWHDRIRHDPNGAAYTVGWISPIQLITRDPPAIRFRRAHMRWTKRELAQSLYELKRRSTVRAVTGDWLTAVAYIQRWLPGTAAWLSSCSTSEGGHGPWVWFGHLSYPKYGTSTTPGGWIQYMQGTFWGDYHRAVAYLRGRGVTVDRATASYTSAVGMALAGAYAYMRGDTGKWTGGGC